MLCLRTSPLPLISNRVQIIKFPQSTSSVVVCALKGPRPRYPRVWKSKKRIGTISKSSKFVECIKGLSNVKEEVYGALDSFVAWELEFPLIAVKKALKTLEVEQEWKRIIQVIKWMLSKGQGRTHGTYFTLLNALAEDGRLEEAEELWTKLFTENLESTPRMFFDKMVSIYYKRDMDEKLFEVFADMEELGLRPSVSVVKMVGNVFRKRGMLDKYEKLKKKYPLPKWEYRYIKGKRVRIRAKLNYESDGANRGINSSEEIPNSSNDSDKDDAVEGINKDEDIPNSSNDSDKDDAVEGVNEDEESSHESNESDEEDADSNVNEVNVDITPS